MRKKIRKQSAAAFIPTGSTMLDCALGGGWAGARIINIVGDRSTGKTLLAIEACANLAMQYKNGLIRYKEAEAAFDPAYAETLGLPIGRVDLEYEFNTVEELQKDMLAFVERCKTKNVPGLYVLDSLDAMSSKAEQNRSIDDSSYGDGKAAKMSELFRRNTRKLKQANVTVLVISQVRDNIGVTYGRKTKRSGGRALDFYASQIVYLAQIKKIHRTVRGVKRPIGVEVRAMVDKNKVGLPFREADFRIVFGYGIDDMASCLDWLKQVKELGKLKISKTQIDTTLKRYQRMPVEERRAFEERVRAHVRRVWQQIENDFAPQTRKYV
jgi:recombination protein RecA